MELVSEDFASGGEIPRAATCEGANESPSLSWSGVPPGTKSLVLIVDDPDAPDPDAPRTTWAHWLLYNMPPGTTALPRAVAARALPRGTLEGKNDWNRTGYGGPCPPIGRHRYFHRLYALDTTLPDLNQPRRTDLLAALEGHVLAKVELVGTYQKHGR
jgi:Raf kinase inhibitor-like YbhB/YbcL family protein